MSFRLITLDLLPLTFDRELKDLVFLNKWLFNHTHLDVHSFTKFITHGPTKLNNFFNSKTLICKTSAFQASYFNRILKLWNYSCFVAPSSLSFQLFVKQTLFERLRTSFDID